MMSWLYDDFHRDREYLERTVAFFQRHARLVMHDPRRTGGGANFLLPRSARRGDLLFTGEAAGFQDALWGFGMRFAMVSGYLAARAVLGNAPADYDRIWGRRLSGHLRAAMVNRSIYRHLGNRGYARLLQEIDHFMRLRPDGRRWLQAYTAPKLWKSLYFPLLRRKLISRRPSPDAGKPGCDCTWCRCRHA